jgi:hypothetical protein
MAKFIYLYRGPAPLPSDATPEQGAERMAAFGAWMDKVARRSSTSAARSGQAHPFEMTGLKEERAT